MYIQWGEEQEAALLHSRQERTPREPSPGGIVLAISICIFESHCLAFTIPSLCRKESWGVLEMEAVVFKEVGFWSDTCLWWHYYLLGWCSFSVLLEVTWTLIQDDMIQPLNSKFTVRSFGAHALHTQRSKLAVLRGWLNCCLAPKKSKHHEGVFITWCISPQIFPQRLSDTREHNMRAQTGQIVPLDPVCGCTKKFTHGLGFRVISRRKSSFCLGQTDCALRWHFHTLTKSFTYLRFPWKQKYLFRFKLWICIASELEVLGMGMLHVWDTFRKFRRLALWIRSIVDSWLSGKLFHQWVEFAWILSDWIRNWHVYFTR